MGVRGGCDLNCGETYADLNESVRKGFISEEEITRSVERLFLARFLLGMFDPPENVPYAQIPIEVNDSTAHQILALEAARQSIVLLKNNGILPIKKDEIKRIAVIGPNANDVPVLLGNYNGTPSQPVTIHAGIKERQGWISGFLRKEL
jgi:beta-glucosidase